MIIDQLFFQMTVIYPYSWASQFPDPQAMALAKSEWHKGLEDLSPFLINRGVERSRLEGTDFPPSIPKFRRFCFPSAEDMGIIPLEMAYNAYSSKIYDNPIVHQCHTLINRFNFDSMPEKDCRKLFKTIYYQCRSEYEIDQIKKIIHKEAIKYILSKQGGLLS